MPHSPPHIKVQRAKVVITVDGRKLFLKSCTRCHVDYYGTDVHVRCENCSKRKYRR